MSIVIHEISHGFMAEYFGDSTARHAGRLTLNPIAHIDMFGSILLPALLIFSHSPFLFGWAKPVPYNPENLRDKKWGTVAVAIAGILANFFIAIIFGIIIRVAPHLSPNLSTSFYFIASIIVLINLALGLFNLVPIPPLDGSKILLALLPTRISRKVELYERYSFVVLIIFIVYFSKFLYPVLAYFFHLFTGLYL